MNVYSMFDRKLRQYGQLILDRNDFSVQRMCADGLKGAPDSLPAKHPGDFDLYEVGKFNDESGLLVAPEGEIPRLVCNLLDLVAKPLSSVKEG